MAVERGLRGVGLRGAIPDPKVLAATVPLVAIGHLSGRPLFRRLSGSSYYEPALTAVRATAVGAGLATALS